MSGRRACSGHSIHPIGRKSSVAPDVTIRFTACKQVSVAGKRTALALKGSYKVQNRGNQWLHKMDLGPTKIKTKTKSTMNNWVTKTLYILVCHNQVSLVILAIAAFGQSDCGDPYTYNLLNSPLCFTSVIVGYWNSMFTAVRSVGEG